jgi:hypothetical protein
MSYDVKIRHTADSGKGVSVEALVNGEAIAHTFPKNMGFFNEPDSGDPRFVKKLKQKYEEKKKREERTQIQNISTEEAKIHGSHFENKRYGSETFKEENNQSGSMDVKLDEPESIRTYLKENMAEGYLSREEGLNIDQFVDEYERLLEMEKSVDEVVKDAIGVE